MANLKYDKEIPGSIPSSRVKATSPPQSLQTRIPRIAIVGAGLWVPPQPMH